MSRPVRMDSRSMLTRAQYMRGVAAGDRTDKGDSATAGLPASKYGFVFTPATPLDSNGNKDAFNGGTADIPLTDTSATAPLAGGVDKGKPNSERPIDRFRRAGMKARIVQRVGKFVEERLSVKQIFNRYVKASTLHGFRFIFTKTFYVRRFMWLILTTAMAVSFLKELHDSISLYYKYPFSTTSTSEYLDVMSFPAVSICNLNRFQTSKMKQTRLAQLVANATRPMNLLWEDPGFEISGEQLKNIMGDASHHIEDMLLSCTWIPRDSHEYRPNLCESKNFSMFYNLYGQYCFTMNSGKRGHPLLLLNETGLTHSFELHVNLSVNDYLPSTHESGLRVIVHDQSQSPLLSTGFVVAPGFHTFVELIPHQIVNLPPPFATKCGEMKLKYFSKYQRTNCFEEELIKLVLETCKCRGVFMPETSEPLCSLRQTHMCLYPTVARFNQKSARFCPIDCQSTYYESHLSYARFMSSPPTGSQSATYLSLLQTESGMTNAELATFYRENVVVMTMFFQDLKLNKVEQEKTYDFWKLIGDVGGQLGLMLGASVLTLVEFIDLIAFMVYHQLLRLSRRHKREKERKNSGNHL